VSAILAFLLGIAVGAVALAVAQALIVGRGLTEPKLDRRDKYPAPPAPRFR
jgi:hypothetical protein